MQKEEGKNAEEKEKVKINSEKKNTNSLYMLFNLTSMELTIITIIPWILNDSYERYGGGAIKKEVRY